jgi:hypothetical protein
MPAALLLILAVIWLPQNALTELALAGRPLHVVSPAFILGAPSLKFYALLGTFFLGLAAFQAGNSIKGRYRGDRENAHRGRRSRPQPALDRGAPATRVGVLDVPWSVSPYPDERQENHADVGRSSAGV